MAAVEIDSMGVGLRCKVDRDGLKTSKKRSVGYELGQDEMWGGSK